MSKAITDAAPHKVAYWFATQGDHEVYWQNVYAAWRAAVRAVPWGSLSPYETPLFPVFSGHLRDREFSEREFGTPSVEGVVFGFREEAVASRVAVALREVRLPQTLAVTCPAPSPDDPRLSFPLTEFLCPSTVVRMNRDHADQSPGFDRAVGLHVAVPADEDEEHALEMATGQPELLPAFLIRMLERTRGPSPSAASERAAGGGAVGYLPSMSPVARQLLEALVAGGRGHGPDHPVFFINELRRFPGDPSAVSGAWQELRTAGYVAEAVKFPDGVMNFGPGGQHFYATALGLKWLSGGEASAGASPATPAPPASSKRFRVALSFAGEKRPFVKQVAEQLASTFRKEEILYDHFHREEFAQPRLGFKLPAMYKDDSDLVAVLICRDYAQKEWPGLEWRKIFEIIMERRDGEVILFCWDHALVDGLGRSDGFFDLDDATPTDVVEAILKRLARIRGTSPSGPVSPVDAPVPDACIDVNTESVATHDIHEMAARLDFAPTIVNETGGWLRAVSAGVLFFADAEETPMPRLLRAGVTIVESPTVRVPRKVKVAPNGASLPLYEDSPLKVRHLPLTLASQDIAPFGSCGAQGGKGIRIPRPIGEPVRWRAAMYVTCEGRPPAWFQLSVQSGANNDMRPHRVNVERVTAGKPVVAYQLQEYVSELGAKVWSPGREPIDPKNTVW